MYLQQHGATVEITDEADRDAFRASLGVADEVASCHTAIVDGYVVEGHVPVEAITRLLAERPDAVGVAVPGMPSDSPGMGGDEATWARQSVVLIGTDGTTTPWEYPAAP